MLINKFELVFSDRARVDIEKLESNQSYRKRLKAVNKALGYLQLDPRHPSLNTHKYSGIKGVNGEDIFEAYAENNTPSAYRIFWHYGPKERYITIVAIIEHP